MKFLGTAKALPRGFLTNDDLAKVVSTNDEWIIARTGIRERRIATADETTIMLAVEAAALALVDACLAPEDIDIVIVATMTAEVRCPSVAAYIQRELGLRNNILAFDLNAACSGFIFSLITAHGLLKDNARALVVGSETLSSITDFTDRSTCILFGDGAGAAVVTLGNGSFEWVTRIEGDDEKLYVSDFIRMDGQSVFKFAVGAITDGVNEVVAKAGCTIHDIDLFICHQANRRILESAAKRLGVPLSRFFINLSYYGNTSAASVPLALDEARHNGLIAPGSRLVLAGFGGGLSAGAIYLEWE